MAFHQNSHILGDVYSGAGFIALLNELEEKIRPERCVVDGLNFWPVLRFEINYYRKTRKSERREAPIDFVVPPLKKRWKMWRARGVAVQPQVTIDAVQKARLEVLPRADVMFANSAGQYLHTISGYAIQPFTDGLQYLLPTNDTRHLTIVNKDPRRTGEDFLISPHVLPLEGIKLARHLKRPKHHVDAVAQQTVLKKVQKVNKILSIYAPDLVLDEGRCLQRVQSALMYTSYFDLVLEKVRPKVIFMGSFTGSHYICAAGKRRGIPVVDIQHGGMHAHHPIAANWHRVPRGGYELLPDVFWCWSQRTADLIAATLSPAHGTVVGGNPKTAFERAWFSSDQSEQPPVGRAQVLVALQYGGDKLIQPHILDAFRQTRNDIDWHFRMHPIGWGRKDEAVKTLGIDEADLVKSSRLPLQNQLMQMDLLLTNMSTIVHDACDIGLPAGVCADEGAAFFDDLLKSGAIRHLRDLDEICATIHDLDLSCQARQIRRDRASALGQAAAAEVKAGYDAILAQCGAR
ncbi:hypothetical protein [uncultured Tateyamaria sp.]|uniref:hypothetical protein n=1 Tax=uncultured Tateyamaria sp. TaxID=455651 RepID=UPI002617F5CE|nr:hypothetical protein [uncultured Tateyamaria sp.]